MNRPCALALTIILFLVFMLLTYYGARVTFWSSFIFGLFVALILLNLFYPVSQSTTDNPDFTLVIYGLLQLFAAIMLAVYITQRTLSDSRKIDCFVPVLV